ncbi:hypothetical protein ACH4ZX_16880 [Streptomyces sp. NPDC020490]|uniref:hypothetical protein n=1 Tax=Streptomyces sp. NPDC020490 TaxID=3365078 RepID=UPI0037A1AE41
MSAEPGAEPGAAPSPGHPVIARVQYDNDFLTVFWAAGHHPAATYRVKVLGDALPVAEVSTGPGNSARLPIELAPGREYEVTVRMSAEGAPPLWSAPVPVTADVVTVERAETDPATGALTLSWQAAETDEFRIRVTLNGTPREPESVATGRSTVLDPLPPGAAATAATARVRRRGDALSIGPYGPAVVLPTRRPDVLAAKFAAGTLSTTWTAVPAADGYRVSVLHRGRVTYESRVPASTTTFHAIPGISDEMDCSVVVQAFTAVGSGPPSLPLPVLHVAPRVTAVRSDGTLLTVGVVPPPGLAPTAYDVTLSRDGTPVHSASLTAAARLSLPVPQPPAPGAAYTVSVRARSGRSTGPATTAPVVPAAPSITAVTCGERLVVTASASGLPQGARVEAVLRADGAEERPRRVGADGTVDFPLPDGPGPATVAVRAVDGVATGPWSAPVTVPTAPVRFTLAQADGGRVRLAWTGAPDATYRVTVGDTAVVTRGQSAELPATADAATVAEVSGVATGPPTAVALVTSAPQIVRAAVDANRRVTLAWTVSGLPLMTGVQPVVRWDGAEVTLDTQRPTTNPIVLTLPDDIPNSASVALRGLTLTGTSPSGNSVALLTVAPTGLRVSYDGAVVTAAWDPARNPLVDRYAVSVTAPGEPEVLVTTAEPRARVTYAPAAALPTEAVVTVAAMAGGIARGLPSAPVAVFERALFAGAARIAPQPGPALAPADITLALPELFATPLTSAVALPLGLTLAPSPSTPHPCTLRVPANSPVWDFTHRPDLVTQWPALLARLQTLGITPYGVAALSEAVSRSLPQTFPETLYLAYGLRFDNGCLDLRPGVILRVEYEGFQVVSGSQGTALSGYVTTASADYEVTAHDRSGRWTSGLDAFLAALTRQGVVVPDPTGPVPGQLYGGGGVLDLFAPTLQQPFTRLVYPPTVLPATSPGSLFPQQHPVLLAAATPDALDAATENVRHRNPPGPGAAAAYFRGRATVRALVRVTVDGAPREVPLGTTLGDVLAGAARRPPAFTLPPGPVTLRRPRAAAVAADGPADGPADDWRVVLGWPDVAPAALDLPLLHGDRVDTVAGDLP